MLLGGLKHRPGKFAVDTSAPFIRRDCGLELRNHGHTGLCYGCGKDVKSGEPFYYVFKRRGVESNRGAYIHQKCIETSRINPTGYGKVNRKRNHYGGGRLGQKPITDPVRTSGAHLHCCVCGTKQVNYAFITGQSLTTEQIGMHERCLSKVPTSLMSKEECKELRQRRLLRERHRKTYYVTAHDGSKESVCLSAKVRKIDGRLTKAYVMVRYDGSWNQTFELVIFEHQKWQVTPDGVRLKVLMHVCSNKLRKGINQWIHKLRTWYDNKGYPKSWDVDNPEVPMMKTVKDFVCYGDQFALEKE